MTELGFTRVAACADCHGALSVAGPSEGERRRGHIVGTIGLVLGLLLVGLILQAVL